MEELSLLVASVNNPNITSKWSLLTSTTKGDQSSYFRDTSTDWFISMGVVQRSNMCKIIVVISSIIKIKFIFGHNRISPDIVTYDL